MKTRVNAPQVADLFWFLWKQVGYRFNLMELLNKAFKDKWTIRFIENPRHFYIICTKRPERALEYFPLLQNAWPVSKFNRLMLMTTAENQHYADLRIPQLLQIPGGLHGVSIEPCLGSVDSRPWIHNGDCRSMPGLECEEVEVDDVQGCICPNECSGRKQIYLNGDYNPDKPETCITYPSHLDWVITGGETGPHARPSHPDWFRQVRDDCAAAGVPFFFKGWGRYAPYQDNGPLPKDCFYLGIDGTRRIGDFEAETDCCMGPNKAAGRLLDGREHNGVPEL